MKKKTILILALGLVLLGGATVGYPVFDHATHAEQELDCDHCHVLPEPSPDWTASMPDRGICLECHDAEEIGPETAAPSTHLGDYRHGHQFDARSGADCATCHAQEESCTMCHHGENVDFLAHDRNWRYFHAMTNYKGVEDCNACHQTQSFCNDCHVAEGVRPGSHLVSGWTAPDLHGAEAKLDLAGCIDCHGGPEPVCRNCHD